MEVRIKEKEVKETIKYPCLMESNDTSLIVLFTSNKSGTIVKANPSWDMGEHWTSWNMSCFHKFQGTLELSN